MLSTEAKEMVNEHLKYYSELKFAPQVKDILVDADGEWFINYLEAAFIEKNEIGYEITYDVMIKHKNSVESKINEYKSDDRILGKYLWVVQYHNYFCILNFPRYNELLIKYSIDGGDVWKIGFTLFKII